MKTVYPTKVQWLKRIKEMFAFRVLIVGLSLLEDWDGLEESRIVVRLEEIEDRIKNIRLAVMGTEIFED